LLSEREQLRAARLHFNQGRSYQEIANSFTQKRKNSGMSPAQVTKNHVSAAIKAAIKNKWVRLTVAPGAERKLVKDHHLANRIKERWGINVVRVLETEPPPLPSDLEDYAQWSDDVHTQLGLTLSEFVLDSIRANDRIGVSSGRGVYGTIAGMYHAVDKIAAEGVQLVSLSGSFEQRSAYDPTIMDADTNVGLLAQCFTRMVRVETTGRDIMSPAPASFKTPPKRALIGIGEASPKSRLFSEGSALNRDLKDALSLLRQLISDIQRDCGYLPVADTCNNLFHVSPPPKHPSQPEGAKVKKLQDLIDTINSRLCTYPIQQMKRVERCWIAAAGETKAAALGHCLSERALQVEALCLDVSLARKLLDLFPE
jgi:DNA-binding transcriptional regulator LsrR (DeoR family)